MISQARLDAKAAAQERRIAAWVNRAAYKVNQAVGVAAAHATKALTDTLKRTRDGRRTLAKARRSRSLQAARDRLQELLDALAGPSIDSVEGFIRDSREDLYKDALARWAAIIPDEYLRPDPATIRVEESLGVRRLTLHGLELRAEIQTPIETAARQLDATIGVAARRSTPDRVATDLIDAWSARAKDGIIAAVRTAIMDGAYRADVAAGWHCVRPELREGESPLHA